MSYSPLRCPQTPNQLLANFVLGWAQQIAPFSTPTLISKTKPYLKTWHLHNKKWRATATQFTPTNSSHPNRFHGQSHLPPQRLHHQDWLEEPSGPQPLGRWSRAATGPAKWSATGMEELVGGWGKNNREIMSCTQWNNCNIPLTHEKQPKMDPKIDWDTFKPSKHVFLLQYSNLYSYTMLHSIHDPRIHPPQISMSPSNLPKTCKNWSRKKKKHAPLFRRCVATLLPIKYLEPKLSWWDKILLGSSLNFVAFCWGINSSHPTSYIGNPYNGYVTPYGIRFMTIPKIYGNNKSWSTRLHI